MCNHSLRRLPFTWVIVVVAIFLHGCGDASTKDLRLGQERSANDEADITASMIEAIKQVSLERYPDGVVKRFNQAKSLGCVAADFTVPADLPADLQQGLFIAGQSYRAKIRFANASTSDDREKDFRGMSIKLFDVAGEPLWGAAGEQDFLLNSYPALFAADPADFLDFIQATRDDKLWRFFIRPSHFYSLKVVLKGREKITDPFAIRYWSTTPYRFGADPSAAVKYSTQSCSTDSVELTGGTNADSLSDAMQQHLRQRPVCFDFMVQFQQHPVSMPIENASVVWDENRSPFIKIARITIADQAFRAELEMQSCEAMRFNPWQSLEAHRPLGGINRVRRPVYAEIGAFRGVQNAAREAAPQ